MINDHQNILHPVGIWKFCLLERINASYIHDEQYELPPSPVSDTFGDLRT